jgi:EamA domain-containing membrane protein RarD
MSLIWNEKKLPIDLTPINLKQLWEAKFLKIIVVHLIIIYHFLILLLWASKGANKTITTRDNKKKIHTCTFIVLILIMSLFAYILSIVHQQCVHYIIYNFSFSKHTSWGHYNHV